MGPFTPALDGSKWVLVCLDLHTRFASSFPITGKDQACVTAALQRLITSEGSPSIIISDNEPVFTGKPFASFLQAHNITHRLIATYHPQTNGACERVIRTLKDLLRAWAAGSNSRSIATWPHALQAATISYNLAPHSATSFPPFLLARGRLPRHPGLHWVPTRPVPVSLPDSQIVCERSNAAKAAQLKAQHSPKNPAPALCSGTWVWSKAPRPRMAIPTKRRRSSHHGVDHSKLSAAPG